MDSREQIQRLLKRHDFCELFLEELGWSTFHHSSAIALPNVGRLPRGWQTKATRRMLESVEKLTFQVQGIAKLGPQVVLRSRESGDRPVSTIHRVRLCRHLARTFYRPIVIVTSEGSQNQDWCFPIRIASGFDHVEFMADGTATQRKLATLLTRLEVNASNLSLLNDHVRLFQLIAEFRHALEPIEVETEESKFARKFQKFGQPAADLATRANVYRARDFEFARETAAKAKAGSRESLELFYWMHLWLVMERARELVSRRATRNSEFGDYVSEGLLGIHSGLRNFDPELGTAPSTLLFSHIEKKIGRSYGLLEPSVWIPTHVQAVLLPAQRSEDLVYDCLAQRHNRLPRDAQVLRALGLKKKSDALAYTFYCAERYDSVSVNQHRFTNYSLPSCLTYEERFNERWNRRGAEARVRLSLLKEREREALLMYLAAHPSAPDRKFTLEEIGQRLNVTRERSRQIILRAIKQLRLLDVEVPDSGEVPTINCLQKRRRGRIRAQGNTVVSSEPVKLQVAIQGRLSNGQQDAQSESELASGFTTRSETVEDEPDGEVAVPPPPIGMSKGNDYIEHLLNQHGARFEPEQLYGALQAHFPQSILNETMIRAKMKRRRLLG